MVLVDTDTPCPRGQRISLTAFKLKKPLGDRKVVTVDDKPMQRDQPGRRLLVHGGEEARHRRLGLSRVS